MAVKKTIELEVDVSGVEKSLIEIQTEFKEVKNSIEDVEKQSKKQTKTTEKGFKRLQGAANKVRKGISGIGLAFKALGVGIFLKAFQFLSEAFLSNQKAADGLAVVTGTIAKIFRDFVDLIVDNTANITNAFKAFFEDPVENIKQFATSIKEGIIDRFNEFKETLGIIGQAVGKLFKGDFAGAVEDLKTAGKEAVDIVTGVDGSFEDVKEKVTNAASAIKDYVTETAESVKVSVDLANAARIAAAEQEKQRLVTLQAAEEQRQIRDDVSKSIEDRIAANEELGRILKEGAEEELRLAELQLAAAEANAALNENDIDLQEELIRAQNLKLEVTERLGGIESEQLTNRNALIQESVDLQTTLLQQTFDLEEAERQSLINLTDNEFEKLRIQQEGAEARKQLALDVFAEQEKLLDKESAAFKEAEAEKTRLVAEANAEEELLDKNLADMKFNLAKDGLKAIAGALNENSAAAKAALTAEAIMSTYKAATTALDSKPFFPLGLIGFATALTTGFTAVKNIVSTKVPGGGSGAAGVSAAAAPIAQAPAFNVVGASPLNQIAETLNNQPPTRAFVVSGDVTTAQQLDRNIINESGI
tara:strand:+ start:706 stop:2475 length:1770 start_codon:yes stop_codon:yes gene_type:complete